MHYKTYGRTTCLEKCLNDASEQEEEDFCVDSKVRWAMGTHPLRSTLSRRMLRKLAYDHNSWMAGSVNNQRL